LETGQEQKIEAAINYNDKIKIQNTKYKPKTSLKTGQEQHSSMNDNDKIK
jgi:hypothetical protein